MRYLDKPKQRNGFTLVELLVVIAIIGTLVALLLPAVQAARESARRTSCQNNLKQIGLSLVNYADIHGEYPSGRSGTGQYSVSWAFKLLPTMEFQTVADSYNPSKRVDDFANAAAMRTPVESFFCPSRRSPAADRNFDNNDQPATLDARKVAAGGDYAANAGQTTMVGFVNGTNRPARVDRVVVGPMYTFSKISGRFVTDGLSNTIAVGERHLPPIPDSTPEGMEDYEQGDTAFFAGDQREAVLRAAAGGIAGDADDPSKEKFGSSHPSISQFVFLDGHVEELDNATEELVLTLLCTIGDGQIITR